MQSQPILNKTNISNILLNLSFTKHADDFLDTVFRYTVFITIFLYLIMHIFLLVIL